MSNSPYSDNNKRGGWRDKDKSTQETGYSWRAEQTRAGRWKYKQATGGFDAAHLVVRVELAAVHVVVVTPERRDQLSRVDGVHGHRALARHKHKLRAAAARHGELELLAVPVGDLPVVHLRDKPHTRLRCGQLALYAKSYENTARLWRCRWKIRAAYKFSSFFKKVFNQLFVESHKRCCKQGSTDSKLIHSNSIQHWIYTNHHLFAETRKNK